MNELQMEQAIQCWGTDLLRFCRIISGNKEEGDDLYQDTMLILLEKMDQLDLMQNVKSYAISVCLKLWKNRNRKIFRRFQLAPQESLEELSEQGILPAADASPEELMIRRNQVLLVRQLVSRLPEKYRIPIQLYYSAGLSIAAVAEVMKLPENTVKSRLHRGKEKIRKKLEELDNE